MSKSFRTNFMTKEQKKISLIKVIITLKFTNHTSFKYVRIIKLIYQIKLIEAVF